MIKTKGCTYILMENWMTVRVLLMQFWGQLTSHQKRALLSGIATDTKAASGMVK